MHNYTELLEKRIFKKPVVKCYRNFLYIYKYIRRNLLDVKHRIFRLSSIKYLFSRKYVSIKYLFPRKKVYGNFPNDQGTVH